MKTTHETILQECLEHLQGGQENLETVLARYPQHAAWLRPALQARQWLDEQRPALAPRSGFVTTSRRRLEARLLLKPTHRLTTIFASLAWSFDARKRLVYGFLLLLMVFQLGLNGFKLNQAAPTWLPGDFLYPLKTASENTALLFTFNRAGDAQLHIRFARQRLLEIQALLFEGQYDEMPGAAARFEYHVTQAVILVERLAKSDPNLAQGLALELKTTLERQSNLIVLLARFAPQGAQAQCDRVRSISVSGIFAVQDILGANDLRYARIAWILTNPGALP